MAEEEYSILFNLARYGTRCVRLGSSRVRRIHTSRDPAILSVVRCGFD